MSKFERSEALFARANDLVAGGVSSQIRRGEKPVPLFFVRGKAGKLWDVDGNEYVDYVQGMGPNIFGHAPDFIIEAVARDMHDGFVFAGQFEKELEVAELVRSMVPLKGPVRFASSGTEIDQLVLRLVRGFTGRRKYVKFEGHYHGWTDTVLYSVHPPLSQAGPDDAPVPVGESKGMAPGSADDIVIAPWNDLATLEKIFERERGQIAGVIMEPILANTNCIVPRPGYLKGVKELCRRDGTLLIFDEVITGFRVAAGGAQETLGVTPDLATYAKSMAGGFPIAMLVGRADIMQMVGDGGVYHGGSFNSNVMSIAAAHASLTHIASDPAGFYRDLTRKGLRLMEGLRSAARRAESDLFVQGVGPVFATTFSSQSEIHDYREHARYCDDARYRRFAELMLGNGVRLATNGRWHVASTHTDEDIDRTVKATEKSLRAM